MKWYNEGPQKFMEDMHSAAQRGDWKEAIRYARSIPLNWDAFQQLPQYQIPPHAIDEVMRHVPGPSKANFLFELAGNMHPGYSHDQLMNLWQNSENDYTLERAVLDHPNWKPTEDLQQKMKASEFWLGYERKVEPHHFATIKSMQTGKAESITDHRGREGSSEHLMGLIPGLKDHAKSVQNAILGDENIQKKYFNGKPYIKLYRGVAGNYGKRITEAAGMDHNGHSVEDRTLSLPVSHMASWTEDPDMAGRFATGRGNIPGQVKGFGVVMSAWHPVESILHSGYHKVHPGQRHAHESESEIIVAHPTGKVKAKTKHMQFQRSVGGSPSDPTFSHIDDMAKPDEIRPKPFRKSDVLNFIDDHDLVFKNIRDFDLSELEIYSDEDGLMKAVQEPKNIGEMHPFDPTLSARLHPISKKLAWHTTPVIARRVDRDIADRTPGFLEKLSPAHRQIMTRAINDVTNSATRHFRLGWDKHPQKQVLRARHIKALLSGQESAKLDTSDPSKLVLTMDRHRGIPGETTSWTLTNEGGHDDGVQKNEFFRRNAEEFHPTRAGLFGGLYDGERSLGDDSGRVRAFDSELRGSGHHQDPRRVSGLAKSSQHQPLIKAPVDTDPSDIKGLAEGGSAKFNPKVHRHVDTNELKGGLYHHVFQVKHDRPNLFVHVISNSRDHKAPTLSTVEGEMDGKALNVTGAYVDPKHAGSGYGKLAYAAALMHHGALRSGLQTSLNANRAWKHMKQNLPGASVQLGANKYGERHSAVVRGDGNELKEHLKAEQYFGPPGLSEPGEGPLTVRGKEVSANPHIKFTTKSSFDPSTGTLHTPKGSFSLSIPSHSDQDYKKILNSSDIQDLHSGAMKNWFKLNDIIRSGGKIPDEIVAHANLFSILSANTPVPQQELLYSRLVDTMRSQNLDPRDPAFGQAFSSGGEGRYAWKESDSPTELPAHSREYWAGRAKPAITQLEPSATTGRQPGDITALGSVDSFSDRIAKYPQVHQYISDLVSRHGGNTQAIVSQMMADKENPKLPKDHPMKVGVGLGAKTARYAMSMLGGGHSVIPDTHFVRHVFGLDATTDTPTSDYLKNILWNPKNHQLLNQIDDYYHKRHPAVKFVTDRYFGGQENPHANFPAFWLHWLSIAPHEKALGIGKPYASKNLTDHTPFFDSANEILERHGLGKVLKKSDNLPLHERTARAMHEMNQKLGPEFTSMVYYGHVLPMLTDGEMTKSESDQGQKVRLVHYSHLPNLTRLDPKFHGTGVRGAERRRGAGPRTFYYFEGTPPEDVVRQQAPHRYVAELPEGHKLYDIGTDPHGVISRAADQARSRQVNPGILTPEEKEEAVKLAGYHGLYDSTHPNIPNAIAYFHPLDVKRENDMAKSFFNQSDEDLEKVGDGYKNLMASGVALLHPVKIGNRDTSNDGIPFHTTIKVFHPKDDRFQQAHEIARELNLTPPDPSKTTVKPKIFKDRFGDDVHVLELGGDAERIVEHNSSFKGMGFPVKFEFRPHITIDEETYNRALNEQPKTAADMGISFSDAELRNGYKTMRTYPWGGNKDGDNKG